MAYRFDLISGSRQCTRSARPQGRRSGGARRGARPGWFLGRQWQLGEHRGTDAASPGLVHVSVTETPLAGRSAAPEDDPRITPPEAVIESEPEQWWTIGRRVRVGRALRNAVPAPQRTSPDLLLPELAPPYDVLKGQGRSTGLRSTAHAAISA